MKFLFMSTFVPMLMMLTSCTFSFHNISTHGNASDVVDEEQESAPNISPNFDIPLASGAKIGNV